MPWSARLDDPIPVPKGKPLVALKGAADYITKLPKIEQHHRSWRAAIEALIMAAEGANELLRLATKPRHRKPAEPMTRSFLYVIRAGHNLVKVGVLT
jgi:hypothetical protein